MGSQLVSTDAKNKLEDLSGITIQPGENPYQALIKTCNNDPVKSPSTQYCEPILMSQPIGRDPSPLPRSQDQTK